MRNFLKFIVGGLVIGLLGLFLINAKALPVQIDLGARGTAALAEQGQGWAKLTINGRNAQIEGFAPSDEAKAKALSIVDGVKGVYRVNDASQKMAEQKPIAPENSKPLSNEVAAPIIVESNLPPISTPIVPVITPISSSVLTSEKQACQVKLNKLLKTNTILFITLSDKVKSVSLPFLSSIVQELKNCTYDELVITAHTDSIGQPDRNQVLSELRAKAVANFLMVGGVAAHKLTSIGKGETDPLALNDTPEGRALNRRIEITVK